MSSRRKPRNVPLLWVLVVAGLAYNGILDYRHTLTGRHLPDGIIGILLGLYICSRPAAHVLDLLLFEGLEQQRYTFRAQVAWVLLNAAVLFVGWTVIVNGSVQFTLATAMAGAAVHAAFLR